MTEQLVKVRENLPPTADALSPIHAEIDHASQVPAETDGSFFKTTSKVNAGGLLTPIDAFSGLPLPILPSSTTMPLHNSEVADWHHSFHPREHPLLKTTGGLALRNCRVQLVPRSLHNETGTRYHKFFEGPPIPETDEDMFRLVVLACAGYIPAHAIDTKSGEPKKVRMNEQQNNMIRQMHRPEPSQKVVNESGRPNFEYRNLRYGYDAVRHFLSDHTIEQPLVHLREGLIDEFLNTSVLQRKEFLGHLLLAKKVEVAAEKVELVYKEARSEQLLHPLMPHSATNFVKYKLGTAEMRKRLFPRLAAQLAVFHGVSGLTIRGERGII